MCHRCARLSRSDDVRPRAPGLSVRAQLGTRWWARGAGVAMAAVFDLDLETEEGSEGEGEPELSPAVSGPPGRRLTPARSRRPGDGIARAPPGREGSGPADAGLSQIPATVKI